MKFFVLVFITLFSVLSLAQEQLPTGSIKGKVIVSESLYPLIGVNILVTHLTQL